LILHPDARWTGALLVGGASRRMGCDKLALRLEGGERLVERPAAALREVCGTLLAVGTPSGGDLGLAGFRAIPDALAGQGPLGGLLAALEAATTRWVLLLAGDMPRLSGAFLAALQAEAMLDPDRALIPRSARGLEPLAAAYPVALAAPVRAALQAGRSAVHAALPVELRRIWDYGGTGEAGRLRDPFLNLNAPEEWAAFAERSVDAQDPPRAS